MLKPIITRIGFVLGFALVGVVPIGHAQIAQLEQTLLGDLFPTDTLNGYGDHQAGNANWYMVGAPREDIDLNANNVIEIGEGEQSVGALYIYKRTPSGFVLHQKLAGEGNSPTIAGDRFGSGIALQGNTMLVGAANDNQFDGTDPNEGGNGPFFFAGKVYVYDYDPKADEWKLIQKLTSDAPSSFGSFGSRTSNSHMELFTTEGINGPSASSPKIAVIGELRNGTEGKGALHVFQRGNNGQWTRIQKVYSPKYDNIPFDGNESFADKVEGVGNHAIVGATDYGLFPDVLGRVYVYEVNSKGIRKVDGKLHPVQTIDAPNGAFNSEACIGMQSSFGDAGLSAAKDFVVIADPCDTGTSVLNTGSIHVYKLGGGKSPLSFVQTIQNPSGVPGALFGSQAIGLGKQSVSTDGKLIVVGTTQFDVDPQEPVQVFAKMGNNMFEHVDSIQRPDPGLPGELFFGHSVQLLSGGQLAIGDMAAYPAPYFPGGAVYLYNLPNY